MNYSASPNITCLTGVSAYNSIIPMIQEGKNMHGFGIMNIRDIIDKYNGTINYEQQGDNYLMCRCAIRKGLSIRLFDN